MPQVRLGGEHRPEQGTPRALRRTVTKYLEKTFTVGMGSRDYRQGWQRIFGGQKEQVGMAELSEQSKWTIERELIPGFEATIRAQQVGIGEARRAVAWEVELSRIEKPSSFVVVVRGIPGASLGSVWLRAVSVLRAYTVNGNEG